MDKKSHLKGKISVHPRGFGFVRPSCDHPDVFIPASKLKGALDGDLVAVERLRKSSKGWEGSVARIIEKGKKVIVAFVVDFDDRENAYLYAPSAGEERTVILTKPSKKLAIGDRLTVTVTKRQDELLYCKLDRFLGSINDAKIDSEVAILESELPPQFPQKILQEADKFPDTFPLTEGRRDLTHLECVTIDPKTARDFDDALSITRDESGNYHLGVHIADVSHYVQEGSPIDEAALIRGNSTYFIDRVLPMLPERLCNDLCSLKENVPRYTASVFMTFDSQGHLQNYDIVKGLIRSRKRLSYEEAKEILDGTVNSPHKKTLQLLEELCLHLKQQRKERGCIELNIPEMRLILDNDGIPKKEEWIPYDITHQLVEEFMLKANEVIATELIRRGKGGIFRIHEEPDQENLEEFLMTARLLGYNVEDTTPERLCLLFEEAKNSPFVDQLSQRYIRTMKLAIYSKKNVGHYGLNLENYTHFTSPIRRYTDLVVHRLLFEPNYDPDLEGIAKQCSETERKSFKAEMSVQRLKKLRYLDRLTDEDPARTFEGVITNIKPQGIIFDLPFIGFEGTIHVSNLGDDYYRYNEKSRSFQGASTKQKFQLGAPIRIRLDTIDLVYGECTWSLVKQGKKGVDRVKRL